MGYIEGFWDCPACKTTGLKGSDQACPHCGKLRDKTTKFYLDLEKNNQRLDSIDNKEPDWLCNYCGALNTDLLDSCATCGSIQNDKNLNYFESREKEEAKKLAKETSLPSTNTLATNKPEFYGLKINYTSIVGHLIAFTGVFALIFLAFNLFSTKTIDVKVESFEWNRTIAVQELRTVQESDWRIPAGGRLTSTKSEFHHNDRVFSHTENKTRTVTKQRQTGTETYVSGHRDMGNGYFEEITSTRPIYETYSDIEHYTEDVYKNVPVYQTKYYYDIDKWVHKRNVSTHGIDKKPYFGNLVLSDNERESSRKETYTIFFSDKKDKKYHLNLNESVWKTYSVGDMIQVNINGFGQITGITENTKGEKIK